MLDYTIPKLVQKKVPVKLKREEFDVYTLFGPAKSPAMEQERQEERTIVLLPGLDDSVFQYEEAFNSIRRVNPRWSILGIDLKGQGKTCDNDHSVSLKPIRLENQTDILNQVITFYELKNIFIVGLSYGAGISLQFASEHPQNVSGLGLIAPYVSEFKTYKPGLAGLYYFLTFLNPFTPKLTGYSLPYYFASARLRGRLNPLVKWSPQKMRALSRLTMGILKLDTDKALDKLAHLRGGVHLLCACQDSVVPIGAHRHFYNRIPNSMDKSFSLEEGIGHRVLSEHPRQAAKWLNRVLPT